MANRWGNNGNSDRLLLGGSKITADGDCSHKIKRRLLLGRKVMTNLDSILKSRDITLPTKVHLQSYGFSNSYVWVWKWKWFSCVWLFATLWTVAYQAPPSMGFSRQESRSGLPFPSPGDLPNLEIKPGSPALQVDSLPSEPPVHWLRFHASNTGGHDLIPEPGTRSHVL